VCLGAFASARIDFAADQEEPALVTDPQILRSFGFRPDARNVYAVMSRLNQTPQIGGEGSDYFGGTSSGFSNYSGSEFQALASSTTFGYCFATGDLTLTSGERSVEVPLDIPNGAKLQAVRWWARDTSQGTDMVFLVYKVCLPNVTAGQPVITTLATAQTLGMLGDQTGDMTILNETVDTKTCRYTVRATFNTFTLCENILYRVRAQWLRQVSPAPTVARFVDVPPNNPFFRFVEALAASGITGGCSSNQYCPDAPVTRGQMAVFLATALGLNWGGL
jgi:hypothetical protein